MKIVIATPFYPPEVGVLATYAQGLEHAFKGKKYEVAVVSLGSLKKLPPGVRHLLYFFHLALRTRGAACILSLDTWSVGVPAYCAARLWGTRFFVRIGGDPLWEAYVERTGEPLRLSEFYTKERHYSRKEHFVSLWLKKLALRADALFFNSRFQQDIWEKAYHPRANMYLLENRYPEAQHAPPPTRSVFVGSVRGARVKNGAVLTDVFARVREKHLDVEIDVQEVPYDEQLKRLREAYAVIIPSFSEVSPNMAIEAVMFGRPFIMSEDSGSKERLAGCGLFVDTRSEEELVAAVERLLDPEVYSECVRNIHNFSFTHSWDEIAEEIAQKI